jgi:predicted amidohydrolase
VSVRIAVVQQAHNPGKVEENRAKALGYARQALDKGADNLRYTGQRPDLYC